MASARSRLEDGQFDSAMMLLKQVTGEDPQNTEAHDLLQEAQGLAELQRVTRTIDQACVQARELAASRDFDAAASLLRRTLQSFPGDPRLEGLLDAVSRQKVEGMPNNACAMRSVPPRNSSANAAIPRPSTRWKPSWRNTPANRRCSSC